MPCPRPASSPEATPMRPAGAKHTRHPCAALRRQAAQLRPAGARRKPRGSHTHAPLTRRERAKAARHALR